MFKQTLENKNVIHFPRSLQLAAEFKEYDFSSSNSQIQELIIDSIDPNQISYAHQHVKIIFCYKPSHVGIEGNEQADIAAEKGTQFAEESTISVIDIVMSTKHQNGTYITMSAKPEDSTKRNTNHILQHISPNSKQK
ncbi:hypothetical protein WA026_009302 [Henosepilachna vigintioctopunctata]|uniref:RNase H type-1 domain-containing protein n=1 Tax=Henosepilachna vigintioctopunctata TaxID=420089 RepID=A0AAW1UYZ1_9CUCU